MTLSSRGLIASPARNRHYPDREQGTRRRYLGLIAESAAATNSWPGGIGMKKA
jgi:hypothetical protein